MSEEEIVSLVLGKFRCVEHKLDRGARCGQCHESARKVAAQIAVRFDRPRMSWPKPDPAEASKHGRLEFFGKAEA